MSEGPVAGTEHLFSGHADGTGLRLLVPDASQLFNVSSSPDGRRLLYDAVRDKNTGIYVVDVASAMETRRTDDAGYDESPVWSPRGDRIAFQSSRGSTGTHVYLINPDGTGLTRVR